MRHKKLALLIAAMAINCAPKNAPEPFGAVPSERQLIWHHMKYHAFIHFGPNTFTDIEWGHGDEPPDVFNPTEMDCRQWAKVIKDAGMEGVIITAKHHDGFCLWPSKYSTHTVRESKCRNGKGDVLKELSEACKEFGIKFAFMSLPGTETTPPTSPINTMMYSRKCLKKSSAITAMCITYFLMGRLVWVLMGKDRNTIGTVSLKSSADASQML